MSPHPDDDPNDDSNDDGVPLLPDGGVDVNHPDFQDDLEAEEEEGHDPDEDLHTALSGDDSEDAQDAHNRLGDQHADYLMRLAVHSAGLGEHPGPYRLKKSSRRKV